MDKNILKMVIAIVNHHQRQWENIGERW